MAVLPHTCVTGSVLGLVDLVSVCCDKVKQQVWYATSIPVWQHVNYLSSSVSEIHFACFWDVLTATKQQQPHLLVIWSGVKLTAKYGLAACVMDHSLCYVYGLWINSLSDYFIPVLLCCICWCLIIIRFIHMRRKWFVHWTVAFEWLGFHLWSKVWKFGCWLLFDLNLIVWFSLTVRNWFCDGQHALQLQVHPVIRVNPFARHFQSLVFSHTWSFLLWTAAHRVEFLMFHLFQATIETGVAQ